MSIKPLSKEFLLAQGKCCKNSCTNCPYSFKNKNMKNKFKVGDKVKIIKYGNIIFWNKQGYQETVATLKKLNKDFMSLMMFGEKIDSELPEIDLEAKPDNILSENEYMWICDSHKDLVGQEGIVEKVSKTEGIKQYQYSLTGVTGKTAWYNEEQLEIIK